MRPEVNNRRGMTLAEIMVALAMVSIMIVMVVSFVMLMSERTRTNAENLAIQQELRQIESGVEGWMNQLTKAGATFATDGDPVSPEETGRYVEGEALYTKLRVTVHGEDGGVGTYFLSFSNHTLKGELEKEGETNRSVTIRTEKVSGIYFDLASKDTDADGTDDEYLLFCIVTVGEADAEGAVETYRFCVNPRVGEQIGGAP